MNTETTKLAPSREKSANREGNNTSRKKTSKQNSQNEKNKKHEKDAE